MDQVPHIAEHVSGINTNRKGYMLQITLYNEAARNELLTNGLNIVNRNMLVQFVRSYTEELKITFYNVPVEDKDISILQNLVTENGYKIVKVEVITINGKKKAYMTGQRRITVHKTKNSQPLPQMITAYRGRSIGVHHFGQSARPDPNQLNRQHQQTTLQQQQPK